MAAAVPESMRDKAAKEVFTSEQSYVKSLQQLYDVWMQGIRKYITDEDFQVIFHNIDSIRLFNYGLVTDLEKRFKLWGETQKFADVFLKQGASLFTIYKPYCENYDRAIERLQQVTAKKSSSIHKFLKSAESQCGGFSLTFYLIMPVQRLPRYAMLLSEVFKKTPAEHPDYQDLQAAIEMIHSVTNEINRGVGDVEKQKKMQDIQKRGFAGLEPLLSDNTRTIVIEGEVEISGGSLKAKSNWGFLFNDLFVAATEAKQREVNTHVPLEHAWMIDLASAGSVNCFEIQTPETSYMITAKDKVTKDRWLEAANTSLAATLQHKGMAKTDENGQPTATRTMNYSFADGSSYSGEWFGGKMQGQGKYSGANGSVFEGVFLKGVMHGAGSARYKSGEVYEGEWARDLPHGKGKLTFSGFKNGKVYEGEWEAGKKKGRGILKWENGDVYDGEWDNDRPHGRGLLTKTDGTKYDGEWKEGRRSGKGVCTSNSGTIYDGEWLNDAHHGKGRFTEPNACVYDGAWVEGRRHGQGAFDSPFLRYDGVWQADRRHGRGTLAVMTSPGVPSNEIYSGDFQFDRKSGQGKQQYNDNSVYEGSWVDGRRHGKGVWVHPNGTRYDGLWKDDLRQGQGVLTESDGSVYEGEWLADKRDGRGKQTHKAGSSYEGAWKNGVRQGEGICTWPDGTKYIGQWIADKRHGQGKLDTLGGAYEGEWKDDRRDGRGVYKGRDGTTFTGEWVADRKHGKGVLVSLGGFETEQQWRDGTLIKPGIKFFAPELADPFFL